MNVTDFTAASLRISIALYAFLLCARISPAQGKMEAELVTIRDGGFVPARVTRPAGPFLLVVKNRTRESEVDLSLVRQDGTVINAIEKVTAVDRDYMLTLPASTYVLKDSAHPSWTSLTIVIQ
jgi:hypothetical protein